jgi:nitrite reductase/ring-hydroxylating ferredoxin subunit
MVMILLPQSSCRRESTIIPFVPVDITININNPAYFDLLIPTGWVYLTGGSMGLIVYRNSEDEFSAYDRHSTHNIDELCRVSVLEDNITIVDECSGSKWIIVDGSVMNGPAFRPLHQYNTTFTNPILRIYN